MASTELPILRTSDEMCSLDGTPTPHVTLKACGRGKRCVYGVTEGSGAIDRSPILDMALGQFADQTLHDPGCLPTH